MAAILSIKLNIFFLMIKGAVEKRVNITVGRHMTWIWLYIRNFRIRNRTVHYCRSSF